MIKFDISIIPDRLEFELKPDGKWYVINTIKKIQLEITDKDICQLLGDCIDCEVEKNKVIELLIITLLNKLEGKM